MKYVDGYVLVVKKKNIEAYRKVAKQGADIWMKNGALQYFECIGDDLLPDMGGFRILTFPEMTKAKKDETVVFSFIVFKSKSHRDKVNAKVFKEMEKETADKKEMKMPFDMKKMAYGGFSAYVEG